MLNHKTKQNNNIVNNNKIVERKAELRSSVAMAFDDMEAMLNDLQKSLDPGGE